MHLRVYEEELTNVLANDLIQCLEALIAYLQLLLGIEVEGFCVHGTNLSELVL